jgi:3',5'-cyclic AMP phosphodiesterase CpdA
MAVHVHSIMQIGDVHFPDAENHTHPVDAKDPRFPKTLERRLAPTPLALVVREAQDRIETAGIGQVVFVGDLTNRGNLEHFETCIEFIKKSFLEHRLLGTKEDSVRILPGNHDLTRNKTFDLDVDKKFSAFNAILRRNNISTIPPDRMVASVIGQSAGTVHVLAVNSCVGCGEARYLPVPGIASHLIEQAQLKSDDALDELLYDDAESIDTPIIDSDVVQQIRKYCSTLAHSSVPVIVGHHNFLPQTRPRTGVHSDLMNGGYFRRALLELDRPLLYLHGHIHDDPIDILGDPSRSAARIVSVSAPLMRDGFNIVRVGFNENGMPLGCAVEKVRMSGDGLVQVSHARTSFWNAERIRSAISPSAAKLLEFLRPNQLAYIHEVVEKLRIPRRAPFTPAEIKALADELQWLNLIEIERIAFDADVWILRRLT